VSLIAETTSLASSVCPFPKMATKVASRATQNSI
jgi:hypothetical protein